MLRPVWLEAPLRSMTLPGKPPALFPVLHLGELYTRSSGLIFPVYNCLHYIAYLNLVIPVSC